MIDPIEQPQAEEPNPLLFWVAYLPGEGDKKNYLSDGKGHLRIFKSEKAAYDFLEPLMPAELFAKVVIHSIQGKIAMPAEEEMPPLKDLLPKHNLSLLPPSGTPIVPFDMRNLVPIRTFAPATHPTSLEQLQNMEQRMKKRRRRK